MNEKEMYDITQDMEIERLYYCIDVKKLRAKNYEYLTDILSNKDNDETKLKILGLLTEYLNISFDEKVLVSLDICMNDSNIELFIDDINICHLYRFMVNYKQDDGSIEIKSDYKLEDVDDDSKSIIRFLSVELIKLFSFINIKDIVENFSKYIGMEV